VGLNHTRPVPSFNAMKCSRKHQPRRSLCKKLRSKPCIINLKSPATQLSGFVAGIFRNCSIKSSAALVRFFYQFRKIGFKSVEYRNLVHFPPQSFFLNFFSSRGTRLGTGRLPRPRSHQQLPSLSEPLKRTEDPSPVDPSMLPLAQQQITGNKQHSNMYISS
jgi:hypothetical protein